LKRLAGEILEKYPCGKEENVNKNGENKKDVKIFQKRIIFA